MFRRWLPQNLQLRLLLAMVLCITIVLMAVTAVSIGVSRSRLMADMVLLGKDYISILNHTSSVYLARQDAHQLTLAAEAATEGDQVEFVAFYSEEGAPIATGASPNAADSARASFGDLLDQVRASGTSAQRWSDDYLELVEPAIYQGQRVGAVALRIDGERLDRNFSDEIWRGAIVAVTLIVLLSLASALMLGQMVIAPLRRLSAAAQQIGAGEWVSPEGQERKDEFGMLARSFGQMVDALRARGDELRDQVQAVQTLNAELDRRVAERTSELNELVAGQELLLSQIRQMSTPVVPVLDGVIVLPIVGSLDSQRAGQLIQSTLAGIEEHHARLAVLDITGVPVVDTHVARALVRAADAAGLLGATAVLVGIRPEVAQTLVQLGVDLAGLRAFATLQDALRMAIGREKQRVVRRS